jgi:acyl-CoA reductase-like NAD-dependent aldehyde dehydrogenase
MRTAWDRRKEIAVSRYRLGINGGGTFTDGVAHDLKTGDLIRSGLGRERDREGIESYLETKTISIPLGI